ncbi:unknown [Coraliomargarita sp. CAG:312]|nr:unknown [Coraliomargarita sp. CAG:312]
MPTDDKTVSMRNLVLKLETNNVGAMPNTLSPSIRNSIFNFASLRKSAHFTIRATKANAGIGETIK